MKIIHELEEQYFEIDKQYAIKQFDAHVKGYNLREDFWKRKRDLNIHAYFLFLFTRLEGHIVSVSSSLITDKKNKIKHWKTRAIWDNIQDDKLNFKTRLGLLTEKGNTVYNKIVKYYKLRNTIAHGGSFSDIDTVINMIDVFDDMKKYFRELKK